jgi:very-short-patch-repair endonuclease
MMMKSRNPPVLERIKFNSRKLRKRGTEPEVLLWSRLRNRMVNGFKFRRQHPRDRYILDFYCHEARLAIEVDGGIHDEQQQIIQDRVRTNFLKESGIHVIRFKNEEILLNIDQVVSRITLSLKNLSRRERSAGTNSDRTGNQIPRGEGK